MNIEFSDKTIQLDSGEMTVVPKGVIHKPFSKKECKILLIEPKNTINTGDVGGELTVSNNQWI